MGMTRGVIEIYQAIFGEIIVTQLWCQFWRSANATLPAVACALEHEHERPGRLWKYIRRGSSFQYNSRPLPSKKRHISEAQLMSMTNAHRTRPTQWTCSSTTLSQAPGIVGELHFAWPARGAKSTGLLVSS